MSWDHAMPDADEIYEPGEPESVHPDDPLIHGPRWRAERDQLRKENAVYYDALLVALPMLPSGSDAREKVDAALNYEHPTAASDARESR